MRLDYDPPSDILIISDGWWVIYYDRKLEQVSHLTKGSTPLGFLLTDHIRLSGDVTVTDVAREDGELQVTLIQTDEPNQGSIQLAFAEEPAGAAALDRGRRAGSGHLCRARCARDRGAAGQGAVPLPQPPVLSWRPQLSPIG